MSILVNKNTKVLVQGITGSAGSFHAKQCLAYGTQIVAGCTPGRGGETFTADGAAGKPVNVPVYDTVVEAVKQTGADTSCIFVPALGAADAILEAVDAGCKLVICITEGIPVTDMIRVRRAIEGKPVNLVHVFGPELRATWKREPYHFDVRLRAYADFAAIRCLAWPMVRVRDPEAEFKSSFEQKYQYHAGVSSRISAALRFHAVRLSADLGFGSYRSIQGLDRFQEQITRDVPGTEVLGERRVEFALEPPGTLLRLYGELAANSHESSLGGEAGERKEQRWLLGAGVAF
jgi:hypothetical protein